ncbi:MAG: nucleotidyltransferase domain-containing protein [Dehalococcoidia bacterium]|nr:nucleotidyltransferase domain-containing protein [Dehalococcoidia bacterium]MXZ89097.1 nucleotidyltransferase domain-containing protein [Dehalococcoidia bacterium]MYA53838.1 nucleotidyltransferase domain-containing protein [Dehalococcoidia bacterium]MYI85900.1 nucleotidyltransferase domain-containing protein [Dehalococcoidia bacterium]
MTPDALIATMVERIADQFDPDRTVLFGSWARGEAKASSDVDLLVVMPDGTDRREAAVAMRVAVGDLPISKDIVVTTPDEIARRAHIVGTVLRAALREGKVVHERP